MRAVWSFWSRPFHTYYGRIWCKPLHHLLAWGLSVDAARRHYPETVLITDRAGKQLLVDQLGLHFTQVSTELERLDGVDPGWWALGKLVAYSLQDRPFVHLDSDVFLWKPLPGHLSASPVFTQYPEGFYDHDPHYHPQDIEWAFAQETAKLPPEWEWTRANRRHFPAENCGSLVARTLNLCATMRARLIPPCGRKTPWLGPACTTSGLQRRAGAVLPLGLRGVPRLHAVSPYRGVRVSRSLQVVGRSLRSNYAARIGFTHLVAGAKSHPAVGKRLEERVRRENPAYFHRCQRVMAKGQF